MDYEKIFEEAYAWLNAKQKKAVDTLDGAVLVVAGPGTGKTQIIGVRSANILKQNGVFPQNILITTFTEAWVIAIRDRLLRFIGTDAYKVNVCTLHSFADEVIKTFPEKFAYEKTEKVIDEIDQLEILKQILREKIDAWEVEELRVTGNDYFYLFDILSNISHLKQEAITMGHFETLINEQEKSYEEALESLKENKRIRDLEKRTVKDKQDYDKKIKKLRELKSIFETYNNYLHDKGFYDFNDMISFVLEKFRTDEDLRYHYAERFQYVMLDEYQDTNNAQNEIISHILTPNKENKNLENPNIMVVWDDDQSIYRFQGANIENMLDFTSHYKQAHIIVLEDNYRSTQAILDTCSLLIKNNDERLVNKIEGLEKKLFAKREEPLFWLPQFYFAGSEIDEQNFVLEKIHEQIRAWTSYEDIAIIVRQNREVEVWSEFLKANEIPVESKQKSNILKSDIINAILNYLSIIENPYVDDRKMIDLLLADFVDVENIDVITLSRLLYQKNYSGRNKLQFFDIIRYDANLRDIELVSGEKISAFREKLLSFKSRLAETTFINFFSFFLEESAILSFLDTEGSFDDMQDVFTLFNVVKTFSSTNSNLSLADFLHKIDLYKQYNKNIPRQTVKSAQKWVQILTAHGSKWLEYTCVCVPWLVAWNWDGKKVVEKIKLPDGIAWEWLQALSEKEQKEIKKMREEEESRRLFFVALSRAKKYLYLSASQVIGNQPKQKSVFVEEIKESLELLKEGTITREQQKELLRSFITWPHLHTFSRPEVDYIEEFLKNYKLSPSELNTFLEDPKLFLHNMIFKYPFAPNEATIFGSVYHRVLELFYGKYISSWKWEEKSYLLSTFEFLLKREILTQVEYERLQKKWQEGLSGYYDTYKNNFWNPLAVEYNFRQKNVFFEDIPLTGKIDKIIKTSDVEPILGQKAPIQIVDYKTGKIKTVGIVKGIDRYGNKKEDLKEWWYFRQLLFYKLLCEQDTDLAHSFEVSELVLDFVEGRDGEYKQLIVSFSEEEYQDFLQLLRDSRSKIKDINYWKELLEIK